MSTDSTKKFGYPTRAIHGKSNTSSWEFSRHLVPPMTTSTTYRLDSLERGAQGFAEFAHKMEEGQKRILVYDRLDEPNTLMLEESIADLENADCAVSFGSGMGAISTCILSQLKSGQTIISHHSIYGCTFSLLKNWLPKFGVQTHFKDLRKFEPSWLKDKSLRLIFFESIANPTLEICDIEHIVDCVRQENLQREEADKIRVAVDNTFATTAAFRPLEHGIDFSIQSLTKNMSGFGTEMGGIIACAGQYEGLLKAARKDFGAVMTPHSAWHILVYGLQTQSLRFHQQQKNALEVATYLEQKTGTLKVTYPGLSSYPQSDLAKRYLKDSDGVFCPGTMLTFEVSTSTEVTRKFVDHIAMNSYSITLAVSLGLTKTLIEVPGLMTHSAMDAQSKEVGNITPTLIRMSVGLEDPKDLIRDLAEAFETIKI